MNESATASCPIRYFRLYYNLILEKMHKSAWALDRGTSPVDWCEGNYLISPVIAEFFNTISNVLFLVLPPLLFSLFKDYAECINRGVQLIWGLLLTVGICSAYFHATLSLVGQLLDELAILWLVMAAFAMWLPRRYFPLWLNRDRKNFQALMMVACMVGTLLVCMHPVLNAFALMWFGVPSTVLLFMELRRCHTVRVIRLGYRCAVIWFVALLCWINDRMFCEMWSAINFPYLHGAWHILIAIAAYTACVLFAYFDACNEAPEALPVLKFWPSDRFELGVPYVALKNSIYKRSHKT